jgi:hypothetical protein
MVNGSGTATDYEFLSRALNGGDGSTAARAAAGATVRDWAAAVLGAVADGRRPLRAVIHPLGFTCLPVERAGRDGVCLHVWGTPGAVVTGVTPIHAHCWELTSFALLGSLRNRLMTVTDAAPAQPGLAYEVLRVRSRGDTDELSPTRRLVHCREHRREVIGAGDTYGVSAGVFHATDVAPGGAAVTVALGRMIDGLPDLSLAPAVGSGATVQQVHRRRCGRAQTARTARDVLGRLQATLAG